MPTFKLNGQDIPFEPGDTIIRAAWRQGIEIPHYCWHPGLSVAANCRMCLVHVTSGRQMALPILEFDEKKGEYVSVTKPKLMPACQMPAGEGMEVDSVGEEVKTAQEHVQEFLLLNHPVDCPICDQAGECKLQDYHEAHSGHEKRKRTEPIHKPKAQKFGPKIVYDGERCIMCTRCIRVCDELVGDHVLDMRERGNRNEIVLAPGRQLDHDYSLMTEHVCPVGALTSRDFRFKARVWALKSADGVCAGCATGCNSHVDFDSRYGKVYRLRPRDNEGVNKFWMCDHGMMTYESVHSGRVTTPSAGRGEELDYLLQEESIDELAAGLRGITDRSKLAVVLSAHHSTEDNFVLAQFAEKFGTDKLYLAALDADEAGWSGDDILKSEDPNPNRAGAEAVAGRKLLAGIEDLVHDAEAGEIEGALILGWASDTNDVSALRELPFVGWLTSNAGPVHEAASVVVPVAHWAEMFGMFRNDRGMDQEFMRAIPPPDGIEPAWRTLVTVGAQLGVALEYQRTGEVRRAMRGVLESNEASAAAAAAPAE